MERQEAMAAALQRNTPMLRLVDRERPLRSCSSQTLGRQRAPWINGATRSLVRLHGYILCIYISHSFTCFSSVFLSVSPLTSTCPSSEEELCIFAAGSPGSLSSPRRTVQFSPMPELSPPASPSCDMWSSELFADEEVLEDRGQDPGVCAVAACPSVGTANMSELDASEFPFRPSEEFAGLVQATGTRLSLFGLSYKRESVTRVCSGHLSNKDEVCARLATAHSASLPSLTTIKTAQLPSDARPVGKKKRYIFNKGAAIRKALGL